MTDFSDQFRKIMMRHKRIGYDLDDMRQSGCLVIYPITVDTLQHSFIARRWIGRQTLSCLHFSWLGPKLFRLLLGPPGLN